MSNITSQQYDEAMSTIRAIQAENSLLKSNLVKANRRADLLQHDLDTIDDFNANCEVSILNSLNRDKHSGH